MLYYLISIMIYVFIFLVKAIAVTLLSLFKVIEDWINDIFLKANNNNKLLKNCSINFKCGGQ